MSTQIIIGDCRDVLKTLPEASAHCCITSPPYFGLRDYGCDGQIGLEPTPDEYIAGMVAVFREVRRVLRDDGTLWLNLGDSYARNPAKGGSGPSGKNRDWYGDNYGDARGADIPFGLKHKDLIGIPWRVAFALQADGWYLRQDIIWAKPNPMPESVRDRCTKSHEYLFLLSKSSRYYFDAEAIAEPIAESSVERLSHAMKACGPRFGGSKYGDDDSEQSRTKSGNVWDGQRKGNRKTFRGGGVYTQGRSFDNDASPCNDSIGNEPNARGLRNKRSVWTIATQPFKEAHFATFPPKLVEPCILAGCPIGGTVLDPFGGAGTTGLVADRLQRSAILIELNAEYAAIAQRRIAGDAPLLQGAAR